LRKAEREIVQSSTQQTGFRNWPTMKLSNVSNTFTIYHYVNSP